MPALAMAQRKLIERIRSFEGVPPPQPHFAKYLQEKGMKTITERTYTSVQLVVGVIKTARQRMRELGLLKKVLLMQIISKFRKMYACTEVRVYTFIEICLCTHNVHTLCIIRS